MVLVAVACAWCGRVHTSGGWQSAADLDLNAPGVTHGICPECLAREIGPAFPPKAPASADLGHAR